MAPGFELEDYEEEQEDVEVWPENEEIFFLFRDLSSQWLTVAAGGMGGGMVIRYALNYPSLYPLLDRISPDNAAWQENFQLIRAMESAALVEMNRKRD